MISKKEFEELKNKFKKHNLEFKIKESKDSFLFTLSGRSSDNLYEASWTVPCSGWLPGMKGKITLHQQTVAFMRICFNALLAQVSDYHYEVIFNDLNFKQLMNREVKQ